MSCPSTPFTIAPDGEVWSLTHIRVGLVGEFVTERGAHQHAARAHQAWLRENPRLAGRTPGCWCPTATCAALTPAS